MTADLRYSRGDVVICAFSGDYGKPRPAVVIQSDLFNDSHETAVLCPITSEITGLALFRVPLARSESSGLRKESEAMVDKLTVARRERIRQRIGHLSPSQLSTIDTALRLWLELPEASG